MKFDRKIVPPEALDSIEGFSHVWVLFVFHENTNAGRTTFKGKGGPTKAKTSGIKFAAKVTPPRLGKRVGVFSTRSPHRPNPIGLTVCSLVTVNSQARTLRLAGVDLVDCTPILDVKPYIPYDSISCSVPSWVEPPITGTLSSGLEVDFSADALEDLNDIFENPTNSCLRVYAKRKETFLRCAREVIAQDPRSVLLKRASSSQDIFNIVIDGVDIFFVTEATRMHVTRVARHS